ncbi:FKBP-type peptidyl-prolyl cis-trans isomerase [Candidatus Marsarchaeota archaeon]|jgi:peptidylprolyl isomerase|nr:FKBP-type peptidyl-prolyl cis-trans isomerase [Candidatus Marsarchaeota archaeon]
MPEANEQIVEKGDSIEVFYTGTLDDGTVFDSNVGKEPLAFTVGSGELIKGFDEGVIGMKLNETKKISIKAADAYGEKRDELIVDVPAENFGEGDVKEGMGVRTEDGHEGTVISIGEKTIKVDFNPQLAGKDLNFEIKIEKIKKHA